MVESDILSETSRWEPDSRRQENVRQARVARGEPTSCSVRCIERLGGIRLVSQGSLKQQEERSSRCVR